jgi:hypothetical protein
MKEINVNEYAALVQAVIGLFAILWIWFTALAVQRRDRFRNQIRMLRDDLFDFMWKHGYEFSSPAYRETRQLLNGLLRLSNVWGPVSFLGSAVIAHSHPIDRQTPFDRLADGELKRELTTVRTAAIALLLDLLFRQGTLGFLVRAILGTFLVFRGIAQFRDQMVRSAQDLVVFIESIGAPDLPRPTKMLMRT